ncbi:hypothetical protein CCAX7_18340 [Capsulimonas corticalis]|uniref:Uncharacterized protein n=1 Tax=Capsulimonas corticalis TaxID=2219043 RepID=A0A402D5F0_9BACT|nr:hypothetical protein [Capsulimonas corticalis]BDI29783.1 hypothetical protein CCAX7_18340 [Capsulimonas corticalis]
MLEESEAHVENSDGPSNRSELPPRQAPPATLRAVSEIPDFPYATFEEFASACRQGDALVWTRYRPSVPRAILSGPNKIIQMIALYSGAWIAAAFAIAAIVSHDGRLALGIPAALLAFVTAQQNLNMASGCLSISATFAAWFAGAIFGWRELLLVGFASCGSWAITSFGLSGADMALRGAMIESEAMLLWLYEQGAIASIHRKDGAPQAAPDPSVWPPPPRTGDSV